MALSILTIATAERAGETKEKNEWVRDTGGDMPFDDLYPETRRKAKETAYHLAYRVGSLSACNGLPPLMKERARIADSILSSIWATMDSEDKRAAS